MATKRRTLFFTDGSRLKNIDLPQYPEEAWTPLFGDGAETPTEDYYKFIPTLYRGAQLRAFAISDMPFEVSRDGEVIDSSTDWQNEVGFMPNPFTLLQLIESALTLSGRCYLFRERNIARDKTLRYVLPTSVTPMIDPIKGLTGFKRPVNGVTRQFKTEDFIYFWLPDPYVEIGVPLNFPGIAASNACGVLLNIDVFASKFFERGAIKAMFLAVKGMPDEVERLKLLDWFQNLFTGVRRSFTTRVINSDSVEAVPIGEGMKELENVTVTKDKQEDIAVALGIPMSILFANAANYATSQQDEVNFISKTIIPECTFIASVLNEQLFTPLGLRWDFLPETLDAMQEDEVARAQALIQVQEAISDPLFEISSQIVGYEVDEDLMAQLKKYWAEKEAEPEPVPPQFAQPAQPPPEEEPEEEEDTLEEQDEEKWMRKALRMLKQGRSPACQFESEHISPLRMADITARLSVARSADEVKAAFGVNGYHLDYMSIIASELKRANDLLERSTPT